MHSYHRTGDTAARDMANAGRTLAVYPWLRMFMLVPAVLAYSWQRSQAQQDQNALFRARRHNLAGPLLLPGVVQPFVNHFLVPGMVKNLVL